MLYVRVDDIDRVRAFTNDALASYDAVLDVSFDVLDEALDESNTLIESQQRLANASGGALNMHWNRTLQTEL